MNFIIRNIWWILLFGFFFFMLFIISVNAPQNTQDKSFSWSTWTIVDVWENIENEKLSYWNEKINNTKKLPTSTNNKNDIQNTSMEVSWVNNTQKISKILESTSLQKDTSIILNNIDYNTSEYSINNEKKDITHNTPIEGWSIWKKYVVKVHALKLNNVDFTQTIWYLKKWDTVIQIWDKNTLSCFRVYMQWEPNKTWYVCEKYLEHVTQNIWWEELQIKNYWNNQQVIPLNNIFKQTKIWDIIILSNFQVDLQDNTALFQGDIIDQLTTLDAFWCFKGRIMKTGTAKIYPNLLWKTFVFCYNQ